MAWTFEIQTSGGFFARLFQNLHKSVSDCSSSGETSSCRSDCLSDCQYSPLRLTNRALLPVEKESTTDLSTG